MPPYKKKKTYRKFAKKPITKAANMAKKRYFYSRGTPKLGAIARDVAFLKTQLNAEHKHIDTIIGAAGSATFATQRPTRETPIVLALNLPSHGTNNNNRIGNQVVFTHVTMKLIFTFDQNNDRYDSITTRARIVWAKDASSVPTIANLLETDANGNYTPNSFTDEQEYRKYIWLKRLNQLQKWRTNKVYPIGDSTGPQTQPLQYDVNASTYYKTTQWNGRIRTEFATGTSTCTINKPYLVLTSDVREHTEYDYNVVNVSGQIRLTYIDN